MLNTKEGRGEKTMKFISFCRSCCKDLTEIVAAELPGVARLSKKSFIQSIKNGDFFEEYNWF